MSKWEVVYVLMRWASGTIVCGGVLLYVYFRLFEEETLRTYLGSFIENYPGPTILMTLVVAYLALKSAMEKVNYYDYFVGFAMILVSVYLFFNWIAE